MKKFLTVVLMLALALTMVACSADPAAKSEGVMTYAEYDAAALETEVVIEAYVQGKQSWWDNKATIYLQDPDGGYFVYEMACTEEDYNKMTVGTKLQVKGYKAEWAGEVEIIDATCTIMEGTWTATAKDVTSLLGNADEMIKNQNQLVSYTDLTIESITYKNNVPGEGNDIWVTVSKDGAEYAFTVEAYLTGPDSDVYKAFVNETVKVGDVVDIEGFLYWYNGVDTHITKISK